jgi:hypothetical protein
MTPTAGVRRTACSSQITNDRRSSIERVRYKQVREATPAMKRKIRQLPGVKLTLSAVLQVRLLE